MTTAPSDPDAATDRLRSNADWARWWTATTRFYAWHLTFEDTALPRLADRYHRRLRGQPGLELVPPAWLHLTLHGVGLVEEIPAGVRDKLARTVSGRLADVPAPTVEFGDWTVDHGTISLLPAVAGPFHRIRDAIRRGMVDVLGAEGVLEPADGTCPHVSLAFVTADQPAGPVFERLAGVAVPTTVHVRKASLLEMYRDRQAYRWRRIAEARLRPPPGPESSAHAE